MDWPREAAEAPPRDQDRRRGLRWPIPAQRVVRIKDPERPYFVDVEICVFDPVSRKLGLLTEGRGPVVILDGCGE